MKNGEMTFLKKTALVIIILTAIIGPWLYHDRAIVRIGTKLTYIQLKVDKIEQLLTLPTSLQASKQSLLPETDRKTKPNLAGLQ